MDVRERRLTGRPRSGPGTRPTAELARLQELERDYALLKEEHDLLRKAIRFCSSATVRALPLKATRPNNHSLRKWCKIPSAILKEAITFTPSVGSRMQPHATLEDKMQALFRVYLAAAVAFAGACSSVPQATTPDQRERLDRIRRETEAAENESSVERMRVHMAEDVVMMAPNIPAVTGATNAAQAMRQFFAAFEVQIHYTSSEIVVTGDWAFDRGVYSQTLTPTQGGTPLRETGKYLWLYQRTPDGSWKQARVIWNSSDPLSGRGT